MYNFYFKNLRKEEGIRELIKVFLEESDFKIFSSAPIKPLSDAVECGDRDFFFEDVPCENHKGGLSQNRLKADIFKKLSGELGTTPSWGIITGIRPVKLFGEIADSFATRNFSLEEAVKKAKKKFLKEYLISKEKADLVEEIYNVQKNAFLKPAYNSFSLYIGIPFCPTRCSYCSFTSEPGTNKDMEEYLDALLSEIGYLSKEIREKCLFPETVYIGGGTPTSLSSEQIKKLLYHIETYLLDGGTREVTFEAGRPDTITKEKVKVLNAGSVTRISINPQTYNEETLKIIGRPHTNSQVEEAFYLSRSLGDFQINCDLICGLPKETIVDFRKSLSWIEEFKPENITVHTLAAKRKSLLTRADREFYRQGEKQVGNMLDEAYKSLKNNAYSPYYLYRQKNMIGAFENVGYSLEGRENLYNVRIMDEHQTIAALGAGGISKAYYPKEDKIERVPNVNNYLIYIDRVEEMIDRKRKNLFKEV